MNPESTRSSDAARDAARDASECEEVVVTINDRGPFIKGRIIDCAWTMSFNPKFDPLKEAVQQVRAAECLRLNLSASDSF